MDRIQAISGQVALSAIVVILFDMLEYNSINNTANSFLIIVIGSAIITGYYNC